MQTSSDKKDIQPGQTFFLIYYQSLAYE